MSNREEARRRPASQHLAACAAAANFQRIGGEAFRRDARRATLRAYRLHLKVDRAWCWFLFGLALLLTGFLIGPRVLPDKQQETCVGNVELPRPLGFSLNCDSPQFTWLARDPAGLLEPQNARQARPGLILAAAFLQTPLSAVAPPGGPPKPAESGLRNPQEISASVARDLPAYLAYVMLNFGILGASFLVLRKVLEGIGGARKHDAWRTMIIVAAGLLLVANDVTKAFVWSPHTQLFNIMVPIMAVHATLRVWSGSLLDRRFAAALGLAVGFGMTAYPVFVVIPVCCLLPGLVLILREKLPRLQRAAVVNLALLLALSALPSALWYAFVRTVTGDFFHFEMAQGEVVWMADAWAKGADVLLGTWLSYAGELIAFAAPQAIPVMALAAVVAWVTVRHHCPLAVLRAAHPAMLAGLYVSVATLGFYASVGWIAERLAYPMMPPLLAGAAAAAIAVLPQLKERGRRELAAGALLAAVAQISYVIIKDGPWS